MRYRRLDSSDLNVSVIAFGGWQLGDPEYWGADAGIDADGTVRAALDAGVTLFDTAEMYGAGRAEEALGRALGARRGEAIIASKVLPQHCAPDALRAACEASLVRLGTDYIDLYQVHWPCRDVPFDETYDALERLRDEGKIRYAGVSNFGPHDLGAWMQHGEAVSNQLGYNLLFRAIEHEIVPACQRHGLGILVYMPLMQGLLSGRWRTVEEIPMLRRRTRHFSSSRDGTRHGEPGCETLLEDTLAKLATIAGETGRTMAELAIAWTISQPGVTAVIVGARKPHQLLRNLAAADWIPEPEVLSQLDTVTQPLKDHFGANADMWQGAESGRIR